MNMDSAQLRTIHDASVALGAEWPDDCWFGSAQDLRDAYDSLGKMVTIDPEGGARVPGRAEQLDPRWSAASTPSRSGH